MKSNLHLIKLVPVLLFCSCTHLLGAEEQAWELRRDREGIQGHTRAVAGSPYDAGRTTTRMEDVRLSALVALIEDPMACADWADRCAESYLLEQISETESYVYTHNDMPFPVKDRDVLAHVTWSQDAHTLAAHMNSIATVGKLDEVRGRLRLMQAVASWDFVPQADGSVLVINEARINPGSSLPGWITNSLLVDTPFETMKAFVSEVRKPKYTQAQLSFIEEPTP